MPAAITPTAFSGAAPPWSLLALDANFTAIQAALANPQIGIGVTADSGGVNGLIATPNPAWSSYVSGTPITVIPANTNTGNTTLNVSGLGTRSVLNPDGSQLLPGALQAGTPYLFMCGTSTFVLLGSSLVQATQGPGGTPFALRNRIINGDMRVDQRNAGAGVVVNNTNIYTVDRWKTYCTLGVGTGSLNVQQINFQGAGGGNPYALSHSVATAKGTLSAGDFALLQQSIEGLNTADLLWGTSSAKSITVSFTFVTSIANAVLPIAVRNNGTNRSYVTSITTGGAGFAARYSVTIPGDTTGTWAIDNTAGIYLSFGWASGSTFQATANTWSANNFFTISGATNFMSSLSNTWQITDVQLEAGSVATPMERIGFDMQLARCMRYFEKSYDYNVIPGTVTNNGLVWATATGFPSAATYSSVLTANYKQTKRATVNPTWYSPNTGATGKVRDTLNGAEIAPSSLTSGMQSATASAINSALATGWSFAGHWTADAEL